MKLLWPQIFFSVQIEIPEQVVVIDPNVLEHNDKLAQMMEKYKDMHNDNSIVQMNELVKNVKKDSKKPKNPGEIFIFLQSILNGIFFNSSN